MTTSSQSTPPTIDVMAATPAHERANDTASAFPAISSAATTSSSTNNPTILSRRSTGPDVPGAYPAERDTGVPDVDLNAAADQVKQMAINVFNTAKEYCGEAGNAASSAVGTAREHLSEQEDIKNSTSNTMGAIKQYLPEKVAAYLPDSVTSTSSPAALPTAEVSGAQIRENTDGVGALPGPVSESGVVVLPEERGSKHLAVRSGLGGVGTLSWAGSESSIAKLPEEKNAARAIPDSTEEISGTNKEAKTREQDTNSKNIQEGREEVTDDIMERHNAKDGHPAQDHPPTDSSAARKSADHSSSRNGSDVITKSTPSEARGNGSTGHKPKFMDRVKGEAKILVGKLGGSEEKVEEGRRMIGKEP